MNFFINNKYFKISLLSPINLSFWWNLGSFMVMVMIIQIVSGIFLTFYYENSSFSFSSLWVIHLEMFFGGIMHYIHLNFASFIFLMMYLHMIKSLLYFSYTNLKLAWISGWMIFMLTMMIAFLGYVLPWGQMSLWGATVITNLLTAIPFGDMIVKWIWSGYFVSVLTMKLFFSLHFLFPIIVLVVMTMHMVVLHYYGSSNPLGSYLNFLKQEFSMMYLMKDMLNIIIIVMMTIWLLLYPISLGDPENFNLANALSSPIHIQPEWYFLQYYAVLRAIPNKLGGVIMFVLSLVFLLLLSIFSMGVKSQIKMGFSLTIMFIMTNILLMWLGGSPVEYPYLFLSQLLTILYFMWFILLKLYLSIFK